MITLNDSFELPSLEQIEEMEKQRMQAIKSLEISNDSDSVKCQKCNAYIPIIGKLPRLHSNRIAVLERRIEWLEERHPHRYHGNNNDNNNGNGVVVQLKQEVAELLSEDAKRDKLRSLPLYSCRITGWKFVCSACYDKVYNNGMLVQGPKGPLS